jgi:hypothetical protein
MHTEIARPAESKRTVDSDKHGDNNLNRDPAIYHSAGQGPASPFDKTLRETDSEITRWPLIPAKSSIIQSTTRISHPLGRQELVHY